MNMQVRQVLEKMSSVEKYYRTAPYLRCGEIITAPNGQVILFYVKLHINMIF
jgi:hypothetical protein